MKVPGGRYCNGSPFHRCHRRCIAILQRSSARVISWAGPRGTVELEPQTTNLHYESGAIGRPSCVGPQCLVCPAAETCTTHGVMGTRNRETPRQKDRHRRTGSKARRHSGCYVARRKYVQCHSWGSTCGTLSTLKQHNHPRQLLRNGCLEAVIASLAGRAFRPRKSDCDPQADFNLCAAGHAYSIETIRSVVFLAWTYKHVFGVETYQFALTPRPLHTRPLKRSPGRGDRQRRCRVARVLVSPTGSRSRIGFCKAVMRCRFGKSWWRSTDFQLGTHRCLASFGNFGPRARECQSIQSSSPPLAKKRRLTTAMVRWFVIPRPENIVVRVYSF